jgi:hypothetical protein
MTVMTMSAREFERMADLVRNDHPSLGKLTLEPYGGYQARSIRLDALMREVKECFAEGFRHRGSDEFPTLYCAWGKSRVGSTALASLFGVAGLPSYYQPVKAVMRQCLNGEAGVPLVPPNAAEHSHVFAKETAGPYLMAECLIIPVQALLEAGYPADKLHVIILDREPLSSLASWINKLSCRVPEALLARHYVLSALNILRVQNYARRHGIATTHYVYECSKDPLRSARALFERVGLSHLFTSDVVNDWNQSGQTKSKPASVIFPTEPHIYDVPGLHAADTAYKYRVGGAASLNPIYADLLHQYGIADIYQDSARACALDLGFDAKVSADILGLDNVRLDHKVVRELEVA